MIFRFPLKVLSACISSDLSVHMDDIHIFTYCTCTSKKSHVIPEWQLSLGARKKGKKGKCLNFHLQHILNMHTHVREVPF